MSDAYFTARRSRLWPALLAFTLVLTIRNAQATTITFPAPESADDHSYNDYAVALLQLALAKANARYEVKVATLAMKQSRAALEIVTASGKIDIMATMTSSEREEQLLPIRIPITKGLMGWRISLLSARHRSQFAQVKTVGDLKPFQAGQGHDWPDIDIMRTNGLAVRAIATFEGMFSMLAAHRIDYFPRPIITVWNETKAHDKLVVDPNIVIRFPTADYFFVGRRNVRLADDVRRGLELAIADGSFDRLFYAHYGEAIELADLPHRRIIDLTNPLLSPATPLARAELWFKLEDLNHENSPSRRKKRVPPEKTH
jgi:hypothetical protein